MNACYKWVLPKIDCRSTKISIVKKVLFTFCIGQSKSPSFQALKEKEMKGRCQCFQNEATRHKHT